MVNNAPIKTITHKDLNIEGYSRAAVQTYWRIPELKLGFDLGGQPWSFMGTPTWFISHTHIDHIMALPVYAARRRMMKMEPPVIYLPEAAERPDTEETDRTPKIDSHDETTAVKQAEERRTVLIAEDDFSMRMLVAKILQRAGFTTVAGETPQACLALVDEGRLAVDLLVTDVVMPGMSGKELHRALLNLYPDLGVLYLSGYTRNVIIHHHVLEPETPFLQKPFSAEQLLGEVRRLIRRHPRH